jgi:hypothetical protein
MVLAKILFKPERDAERKDVMQDLMVKFLYVPTIRSS